MVKKREKISYKDKMPKISVIMPVYNGERFLAESLNSVLEQTFCEYEILCIDDGSTDSTIRILEKYQEKDCRIKVLQNKKREGAAYSRNKGIKYSRGKYLIFLDSDDIFEEEMLETVYEAAERNNTDIIMFDYQKMDSMHIREKKYVYHGTEYINEYCNSVFSVENYKPCEFILWATSPCNKLFKKQFILESNINFQSLSCSNDVYFVNMALMLSERTMMLNDKRNMIYVREHDTTTRISSHRDPMCSFYAYNHILDELISRGKLESLYLHFYYKAFFAFRHILLTHRNVEEKINFYKFLQREGIQKLLNKSETYKLVLNDYIDNNLRMILTREYDLEWIEKRNLLEVTVYDKKEKFCDLFNRRGNRNKIVLWGAGQNGKIVLKNCRKHNILIDHVVDKNFKRHGEYIEGYIIENPENVLKSSALVIVTPSGFFSEIQKTVLEYNSESEVIDITEYMAII